jgi:hypothetical protein
MLQSRQPPDYNRLGQISEQLEQFERQFESTRNTVPVPHYVEQWITMTKEAVALLNIAAPWMDPAWEEMSAITGARGGDLRNLIAYLRSGQPMSITARNFLADLLEGKIKRDLGRPSGAVTGDVTQIENAVVVAAMLAQKDREAGRRPRYRKAASDAVRLRGLNPRRTDEVAERLRRGRVVPRIMNGLVLHSKTVRMAIGIVLADKVQDKNSGLIW